MPLRLFDSEQPEPTRGPLTVARVIDQYLEAKADLVTSGLVGKPAFEQSRRYLGDFSRHFGAMAVAECRRGDLKRFLGKHPEYVSPHTKHTAVGQVIACFRWAEEDGLIERCPYSRPKDLPACEPRQHITREEVGRILWFAKTEGYKKTRRAFRLALWFMFETGCRTGELRSLCWEHYDDARGLFELKGKSTHKTGQKRLIVLSHRAWRLIRWMQRRLVFHGGLPSPSQDLPAHHANRQLLAGPVFLNAVGKPWDKDLFSRRFRDYARGAGVRDEVSAYSCRHGFCVESLEAGAGERQIADLMGHTSTRYIAWYGRGAKKNIEYLRATANRRDQENKSS